MQLINGRTAQVVATSVELASTRAERRRGLLGRDGLDRSTAMILTPCFAIHTAFMRFAIDALFVDREGIVRRVVLTMKPWRMAVDVRANAVIELASGVAGGLDVRVGDRLYLSAAPGSERPWSSLAAAS